MLTALQNCTEVVQSAALHNVKATCHNTKFSSIWQHKVSHKKVQLLVL